MRFAAAVASLIEKQASVAEEFVDLGQAGAAVDECQDEGPAEF